MRRERPAWGCELRCQRVCWCDHSLYQLFKLTNGHGPPGVLANYKRAYCGAKQGQFLPGVLLLTPLTQCDKPGPKTESSPQVGLLPEVDQNKQSPNVMGDASVCVRACGAYMCGCVCYAYVQKASIAPCPCVCVSHRSAKKATGHFQVI